MGRMAMIIVHGAIILPVYPLQVGSVLPEETEVDSFLKAINISLFFV
jgi:hypothetical protein